MEMLSSRTWQAVVSLAIVAAVVIALAIFTDWGSTEIMGVAVGLAGVAAGTTIGGSIASGVRDRVEEIKTETGQQSATLATVARRVNGELDARLHAAVAAGQEETADMAAARVISALREKGLI